MPELMAKRDRRAETRRAGPLARRARRGPGLPALAAAPTTSSSWARASTTIRAPRTAATPPRSRSTTPSDEPGRAARPDRAGAAPRQRAGGAVGAAAARSWTAATPLIVAKSNLRSRVHRRVYMDYVGVRRYGAGRQGRPARSASSACSPPRPTTSRRSEMPLIRRKVAHVHGARRPGRRAATTTCGCANILETYPRDELFQIDRGRPAARSRSASCTSTTGRGCKLFVRARPVRPLRLDPAVYAAARTLRRRACASAAGADPGRGLRRPGLGLLSELLRRAAGAGPLHHRRHARRPPRAGPGRAGSARSPRPRAPGATLRGGRCATPGPPDQATGAARWPLGGRLPGRLPRPLRRRARRWPTSPRSSSSAPTAPVARARLPPRRRLRRCSFRFKLYRAGDAGAAGRRAADPRQHGPEGAGRGGLRRSPRAGDGARRRSGCTSSLLEDPRGERLDLRRRQARRSRTPSWPSGPAGPRTTASTAWCSSWASPGARRRWCARWPAIASSRASIPARRCRRQALSDHPGGRAR